MKVNKLSFLIGGEAGAGITRSGFLFAKTCMRAGLNVFGTNDYQSLIKGDTTSTLFKWTLRKFFRKLTKSTFFWL